MYNLKEIRKNFSEFAKSLEKRSVNVDFANLEKLDELNRELIQKKESLKNEEMKYCLYTNMFLTICIIGFNYFRR